MMTIDHETLKGVMERSPRKMSDRLLDRSLILKAFFWYGMLESLLAMIGFFVTYWTSQGHFNHLAASGSLYKEATTMTLGAIIFAQMGMVMIARSDGHSIRHPFRNCPLYSPHLHPLPTKNL